MDTNDINFNAQTDESFKKDNEPVKHVKKINPLSYSALFLTLVLVHIGLSFFVSLLGIKIHISFLGGLILSELTILVPGLIWILFNNSSKSFLGFNKIKISTALMCIVLAYLIMPLTALINLVSQFFTTNAAASMSTDIVEYNFFLMLLIVGILGPATEEFVFRGILFRGMNKFAGGIMAALVSGFMFGILHLNLNQFLYAFFLGLIFATVNYVTDSIIPSMVMHIVINSHNVILMYASLGLYSKMGMNIDDLSAVADNDMLYGAVAVFLVLSLVCTTIAIPAFFYIAKNEGNPSGYISFFKRSSCIENNNDACKIKWYINIYSISALLICLFVMFGLEPLVNALGL